jgi:hypothetical protein
VKEKKTNVIRKMKLRKKDLHKTIEGEVVKERRTNIVGEMKLQEKDRHKIAKGKTMKERKTNLQKFEGDDDNNGKAS